MKKAIIPISVMIFMIISLLLVWDNNKVDLPASAFERMDQPLPPIHLSSLTTDGKLPDSPFLLVIWASWCPACRAEHFYLETVAKSIPIIGVTVNDDDTLVKEFLARNGNPYAKIYSDSNGLYSKSIGAQGTPTVFFVDADKKMRARLTGGINKRKWIDKKLNRFVAKL